jgi:hypothetical protein
MRNLQICRHLVPICGVGYPISNVACDSWTLRMYGGLLNRRRLVGLAGLSGASRNHLGNSPADEKPSAMPAHYFLTPMARARLELTTFAILLR